MYYHKRAYNLSQTGLSGMDSGEYCMWNITNFPEYQRLCQVPLQIHEARLLVQKVLKLFIIDSSVQIGKNVKVVWRFYKGKNGNCKNKKLCFIV